MSSDAREAAWRRRRRWLSLVLVQVSLLLSAPNLLASSHAHRGWWVAAAVVIELALVGAAVEVAVRNRREAGAESRS